MTTEVTIRTVETNGIRMHLAEAGAGPLVMLCHGFPESWYSWRHQLAALAEAGFRAVAPDMRGYGQTGRPEAIDQYTLFHLIGDAVGLLDALGADQAVIAGHDWGAPVAWHAALLRPDRFRGVIGLSVPYRPRGNVRPTELMRSLAGENQFYQLYFQEPGKAEAELEADTRRSVRMLLYAASGDPPPEKRWRFLFGKDETLLSTGSEPDTLPAWLTEPDVEAFTAEFTRTGFWGGLNWYRNLDRMWELTPFLNGAKLRQPALFVAGERDVCITMYRDAFEALPQTVPGLRQRVLLPGAGHWILQERPGEVNRLLVAFLKGL